MKNVMKCSMLFLVGVLIAVTCYGENKQTPVTSAIKADAIKGGVFFSDVKPVLFPNVRNKVVLGLRFRVKKAAKMTAVCFYQTQGEVDTKHDFVLWDAKGEKLLTINADAVDTVGWVNIPLKEAFALAANTEYTISYICNKSYGGTYHVFKSPIEKHGITALKGVYSRNLNACPKKTHKHLNYFIDMKLMFTGIKPNISAQPKVKPDISKIIVNSEVKSSKTGVKMDNKFEILSTTIKRDKSVYPEGTILIKFKSAFDGKQDWALFTPGDVSKNLIVYLHGSFSHADQIYTRQDIRKFWLSRIRAGNHPLLSINMRNTSYMSPAATQDLSDLLDYCRKKLSAKKIILLGGSGGASSALAFACVYPRKIDGVIAMGMCDIVARLDFARKSKNGILRKLAKVVFTAYGGNLEEKSELYRARSVLQNIEKLNMPIVLTIGENDSSIPSVETRKIAEAMKGKKNFTYYEIPGGNHDSAVWVDISLQDIKIKGCLFDLSKAVIVKSEAQSGEGGIFFARTKPITEDNGMYELGLKFYMEKAGAIKSLCFYQAKNEKGAHTFRLWDIYGKLLLIVNVSAIEKSGWIDIPLPKPFAVAASTEYIVSYTCNKAFPRTLNFFNSAVKKDGIMALAGHFSKNVSGKKYPDRTYKKTNYFIDVIFSKED